MVDSRRESGGRALSALERALQSAAFLVEDRLTIADIAVYAYGHRAEEAGFAFKHYPAVFRWLNRVADLIGPDYPVYPYGAEAQLGSARQ
jgi:glutathione S-transferase